MPLTRPDAPPLSPITEALRWLAGASPGMASVGPSPEELQAFDAHRLAVSARMWPRLGMLLAVGAVMWWPLDLVFFEGWTRTCFALLRGGIVVLSLAPAAAAKLFWSLGTRWGLVLLTTVMLAQGAWAGVCISLASDGDPAWFGFFYPVPAFTILLLVPFTQRVLVTLLLSTTTWLAFHLTAPELPELAAVAASQMLFVTGLAVGLGHMFYEAILGQFVLGLRLDVQRAATARLNERLQERVDEQTADLLELSKQAQRARGDERKRIARNLHDELGQELTAMSLLMSHLQATTPDLEAGPLNTALGRVRETLAGVLDDLEPRGLDALGLEGALEQLMREHCELAGLEWELQVGPLENPVPDAHAIVLFRVAQEGLTNALRHAKGGSVRLRVADDGPRVVLTLADDGQGITPGGREGRGMSIIRDRCSALGGSADWLSSGAGATLQVSLPRRTA